MKKNRLLALVLTIAMVCAAAGVCAYAAPGEEPAEKRETAKPQTASAAGTKTEVVYVMAGADGRTKSVIVSDRFENADQQDVQKAVGQLTDVQNVKADTCWMGTTQQEPPVELKLSYTLDGKTVTPQELAGKSGRVTIRFDYTNTQRETVELNGRQQTLYVPFAALTGAMLDSGRFSNVTVEGGRLFCDGDHIVVVGLAFPGLQEDLGLEVPSFVEVCADVKDFSLETTYTLVTNSPFMSLETGRLDLDALSGGFSQLTDAMDQLTGGSEALCDGLQTLLDRSGDLSAGMDQLSGGLSALSSRSGELNSGAKQVFESLLSTADAQLAAAGLEVPKLTIENYGSVLGGVLEQLDGAGSYAEETAREQVRQSVLAQEDTIRAGVGQAVAQEVTQQVSQEVRQTVWQKILAAQGLDQKSYDAGVAAGVVTQSQQDQLQAELERQMASDAVQATISKTVEEKMASSEIEAVIDAKTDEQVELLVEQNMASGQVQEKISAAAAQASSGAASVRALRQQLDSYNAFYKGLAAYTGGVDAASSGAAQLKSGVPALIDGVSQLQGGAQQLSDGLQEFAQEGVEKLLGAFDEDLPQRLQKTAELSKTYSSFTGGQGLDGTVKFIYRTEAIAALD